MTDAERVEFVAKEIYFAAYDRHDAAARHPLGFTKEQAWERCSETQRAFNRRMAERAISAIKKVSLL